MIVINDGSTDSTKAIAEEYEHNYSDIFRVINKENGGYGSALNVGIREAKGKYLKILDADDWYNTDALQELLKRLVVTDCDMVVTDYEVINDKTGGKELRKFKIPENSVFSMENIELPQQALYMHSLCYKTELFKQNNIQITENCFYTDMQYALYPLKYADTVIYYSLSLYCYRIGREGQSMSVEGLKKHICDHEKVIDDVNTYFADGMNRNCKIIERGIASIYAGYVLQLLRLPCNKRNRKCIKKYLEEVADKYSYGYSCFENNKLYLLRKSHYMFYRPCSWYVKHIESKKN